MRVRFVGMVLVAATVAWAPRSPLAGEEPAFSPHPDLAAACGARRTLAEASGPTAVVARPNPPYFVASTHFVVRYSVRSLDIYARDVIDAAEHSYRVLVDTLAHATPPSDGTAGGDGRIDIYLRPPLELGGAWGTTIPDERIGTPYFNTFTSWIELSDDLPFERRVTVTAHEVYHVVQLGYDRYESLSILEMFSSWFEDRAYDSINSHYIWLPQFFRRTDRALFEQNYTNVPWAIFLTERYGDGIMPATLVFCGQTPGPNPRGAFDGVLRTMVNTTLQDEFVEFGTWNFFVSLRDDGEHYSEGRNFPALRCQVRSDCYPVVGHDANHPPRDLAANYFLFDGNGHRGRLWVRVEPEPLATAFLTVIRFRGSTRDRAVTRYELGAEPDSFVVDDWSRCDSLLVIYQVDRGVAEGNRVVVSARYEPEPAPAMPWTLVLDRDGCRNPFDGDGDEFARRDGEEAPIAAALDAAGANPFVTDEIPPDLGGCRAVFLVGGFGDGGVTLSRDDMAALSHYMDQGGDVYLESARLGAWVDSSLAKGDPDLPAFWSFFGSTFQAGEDSANVASWRTEGTPRPHQFVYDPGEPDYRVGVLGAIESSPLVRDDRNHVRATVRAAGESVRIASTVLLGGSTGTSGSTREAFIADVLEMFDQQPVTVPPPAALRLTNVFPNPAQDAAELSIEAPSNGPASIVVYDVAGRRVLATTTSLVAGRNAVRLPTPRASGVYFLTVDAGGVRARGRFLVIR
ncbi:MAG TPA: T9SS type A sorting domain-containing protein [Candidatus Krumholzibacteria bacterium]|nr:T9SS type A sorting domain-containing protein [Candidatus Krumholzibacteria bacterium]